MDRGGGIIPPMRKRLGSLVFLLVFCCAAPPQLWAQTWGLPQDNEPGAGPTDKLGVSPHAPLGEGEDESTAVSLNGDWELLLDPHNDGGPRRLALGREQAWASALSVAVPGVLEQLPESAGYDGVVWYRRLVPTTPTPARPQRLLLEFGSANYRADVWLGGDYLGRHDGSDSPFAFDVSGRLDAPETALVVRVVDPGHEKIDGLVLGALPHAKESWYFNYGGLTGAVSLRSADLVEVFAPTVDWRPDGTASLRLSLINRSEASREVRLAAGLGVSGAELGDWDQSRRPPSKAPMVAAAGKGGFSTLAVTAQPGRTTVTLPLASLSALQPWHPSNPVLHELQLLLTDAGHRRLTAHSVGLRHFTVDGDHFVLNGEPIYLRGVLYQPYYPQGLANPPSQEWLRSELQAIKDAGFNLVRAHIRVMQPVYALCDELGLLVQAEPTLGWITVRNKHTLPAVDLALQTLADAVAAHPSVVIVGILNEMSGELYTETRRLLRDAALLMPELLVFDDSGSWQGSAHYIAPGTEEPVPFDDLHVYRSWPWTETDLDFAAHLGADTERLIYVSEYGYGGLPNYDVTAGFAGFEFLEDGQLALADAAAAQADIDRDRLQGQIDTLDMLSHMGGLNQARAAEVMATALRSNPRVAGDTYTQWRDAAWECGAGLTDLWARPKPALAALSALNALPGRPESDHVTRDATPPPRLRAAVATGEVMALTGRENELVRELVAPSLAPGDEGPGGLAPGDQRPGGPGLTSAEPGTLPRLVVMGRRPAMWGELGLATTVQQLRFAYEGGVVLMLEPPDAGHPFDAFFFGYDGLGQVAALPFDVAARSSRGHFIGRHLIFAADSVLLDDLGLDVPLIDERLAAASPHRVLDVHDDHGAEIALDCLDGYGLSVGAAVQSVPFGKGRIVLSTLRFDDDSLQQPMVVRLLENVVRYAADQAASLPPTHDIATPAPAPESDVDANADANADANVATLVGQAVWRLKIWFGMAERLAVQTFNGIRPRRNELPALRTVTTAKIEGLLAVILGEAPRGQALLMNTAESAMTGELELFLRKELALSRAFYRPAETDPAPRGLAQTLAVGRAYALSLVEQRKGNAAAALEKLREAQVLVAALDGEATTAPGEANNDVPLDTAKTTPESSGDDGATDSTHDQKR